ncbi:uncharacterized protein [Henckelia pumila]|uniref:uncharacterized protein n=1 Tax=Henckelia pumila TaxID=405737 RepID=UPI003C6E67F8
MDEEKMMEEPKISEPKEDMRAENSSKAAALAQIPNYAKFLKDLLRNKKKLNDLTQVTLNEECLNLLQKELSQKFHDPWNFSIPCHIGKFSVNNVLCDLGSSLNLMSHALAKKLGICNTEPSNISLKFADGSSKFPRGVVENVLVKIDKFIYPIDFVILDMNSDCDVPLILGRRFLFMSRALVDV